MSVRAPPAGDRTHHYELTELALDVLTLGLPPITGGAGLGSSMRLHILAFGRLVATAGEPAA